MRVETGFCRRLAWHLGMLCNDQAKQWQTMQNFVLPNAFDGIQRMRRTVELAAATVPASGDKCCAPHRWRGACQLHAIQPRTCTLGPNKTLSPMVMALVSKNTQLKLQSVHQMHRCQKNNMHATCGVEHGLSVDRRGTGGDTRRSGRTTHRNCAQA